MPYVAPPPPAGFAETMAALIAFCNTIEAAALSGGGETVANYTGNHTFTAAESGTMAHNAGASGTVVLSLPPATTVGLKFGAYVAAQQTIRFDAAGSDYIKNGGDSSSAGGTFEANTVGNFVRLQVLVEGTWSALGILGDWTTG